MTPLTPVTDVTTATIEQPSYNHSKFKSLLQKWRRAAPRIPAPRPALLLALILLLALALRLSLFIAGPMHDIHRAIFPDSGRYIELAENLVATHQFAKSPEDNGLIHVPLQALRAQRHELPPLNSYDQRPELLRTPGYPLVIALALLITDSLHAALILQCLLSTLSVYLLYRLTRQLINSQPVALLAAFLFAIHPGEIVSANSFLSESPFITAFLASLVLTLAALQRRSWTLTLGAGLLIGLAILIRPIAIVVLPALAITILMIRPLKKTLAPRPLQTPLPQHPNLSFKAPRTSRSLPHLLHAFPNLAFIALLSISTAILPLGWCARNKAAGNSFTLSNISAISAWFYTASHMNIREAGGDLYLDWPVQTEHQMQILATSLLPGETTTHGMNRLARQRILSNPSLYASLLADASVKFFTDHSADALSHLLGRPYQPTGLRDRILSHPLSLLTDPPSPTMLLPITWSALNALLAVLTLVCFIRMLLARQFFPVILLGMLTAAFVFASQTSAIERFHLPVLPLQFLAIATLLSPLPKSIPINIPNPLRHLRKQTRTAPSLTS